MSHVLDTSIWGRKESALASKEGRLFIGVVREVRNDKTTHELRYMVEVYSRSDTLILPCRQLRAWGGVYNYEDSVSRGYDHPNAAKNQNGTLALAGDLVLVGYIGGNEREGVILGGMTHPARQSFLDATKGPQYKSEFNGIETHINEDGEWTLTFRGQPTNLQKLKEAPNQVLPAPEYDKDVGTSFMKWDKTGSFTLSTNDDKLQKLFLDKKNHKSILTTPFCIIKSEKIRLGEEGASDWLILGSTFRDKQKTMNKKMSIQLALAKSSLSVAKTALQTAGSSMATPIVGAIAAGPQIVAASVAIDLAAQALGEVGTAINDFESGGATHDYLSAITKTK